MAKALTEVLATLDGMASPIESDPLEAIAAELARSNGALDFLEQQVRSLRMPEATTGGSAYGPEYKAMALNPLLDMFNQERDRNAKLADLAHRAGVQDQQVQIMRDQAELIAAVLRRVLDDVELGLSGSQRERFLSIAAAQFSVLDTAS